MDETNQPLLQTGASQAALETVLDSLDALVYVADMQTHELLFLNAYGRARWGQVDQRTCWETLQQGQDGPCSFCNNNQLIDDQGQPAAVQVWEFRNTHNQRWYQCRDQAIRWPDGRLVRLEIATDISDIKRLQAQLRSAQHRAEQLAHEDALTGLANRRALFALGQSAIEQARRLGHPIALIGLDADHFKRVNDQHGHAAGDAVLKALAATLRSVTRASDVCARLGGEEFTVLSPGTDLAGATELAERLRQAIADLRVEYQGEQLLITCSFGVTASEQGAASLEQLLNIADIATYRAKHLGRNRVEVEHIIAVKQTE
jgi:diguanylate cyclase (GGDEF)-like protein